MGFLFLVTRDLEHMRDKPGMYFQPPLFPALCSYVDGCHATLRDVAPEHPLCLELAGFDDWLCARYQIGLPSFRWRQIIRERAPEDPDRVRLFVDLFLAYRRERGVDPLAALPAAFVARFRRPLDALSARRVLNAAGAHDNTGMELYGEADYEEVGQGGAFGKLVREQMLHLWWD